MLRLADDTGAVLLYADRINRVDGCLEPWPVIDWQEGSLRDDFDFGSVLLVRNSALVANTSITRTRKTCAAPGRSSSTM